MENNQILEILYRDGYHYAAKWIEELVERCNLLEQENAEVLKGAGK